MFTTHPSVVRLGRRSDLPVDSPSGQSCRWGSNGHCAEKRPVTVGVARWVGAVTVVRTDGVDFPAHDYGTRYLEQTYSTPDLCVCADDSRN
jgi:hypothetical protein